MNATPIPKGKERKEKRKQILQHLKTATANRDRENRPRYYFIKDQEGKPVVTVCDIVYNDILCRGISICSFRDAPRKKTGKRIALDRAIAAIINQNNVLPTQRREVSWIKGDLEVSPDELPNMDYKGYYDLSLNSSS